MLHSPRASVRGAAGGMTVKQAGSIVLSLIVVLCTLSYLPPSTDPAQVFDLESTDDDEGDWCGRFKIFVYDLPRNIQQNLETVEEDQYAYLHNGGFGVSSMLDLDKTLHAHLHLTPEKYWTTDQTGLEIMMHKRLLNSCYRTTDPAAADLFYIPFYGALHVMGHARSAYSSDSVDTALHDFIQQFPYWNASHGRDHVIMFSRPEVFALNNTGPPNGFLGPLHPSAPFLQNMLKLVLETNPWSTLPNVVSVPYPSAWHYVPTQSKLRGSGPELPWRPRTRRMTVAFIGGLHRGSMSGDGTIRTLLAEQCEARQKTGCLMSGAKHLSSKVATETALSTYLLSTFSMQPQGDSFTRKGVFDSLLAGCIPVYFHKLSFQNQYPWHITSEEFKRVSVFVPAAVVRQDGFNIVDHLKAIPEQQVHDMQAQVRRIAFRLQYSTAAGGAARPDAFEAVVRGLRKYAQQTRADHATAV